MSTAQSELDLSYGQRYQDVTIPEAYERLILDTYITISFYKITQHNFFYISAAFFCDFVHKSLPQMRIYSKVYIGVLNIDFYFLQYKGRSAAFCSQRRIEGVQMTNLTISACQISYLFDSNVYLISLHYQAAWEIFTPLLHRIDNGEFKSIPYKPGSRGPEEADELLKKVGYVQTHGYIWIPPTL